MKSIRKKLTLFWLSTSLMSCSIYQNNDVGKVVGTLSGGLLGSAIGQGTGTVLAIGTGMVAGFIIGNAIGNAMDDTLARRLNGSFFYNQTNQSSCWMDAWGTRYVITPTSDVIASNDIPACRQYSLTVISTNGATHQEQGVACMQEDATWAVLKNSTAPGVGVYRPLLDR